MNTNASPLSHQTGTVDVSRRLYERARRVLPGGNTRTTVYRKPFPFYAAQAEGPVITDADGNQRIDFVNNYTTLIHGHVDPDILAAVQEQLPKSTVYGMPTEHEILLAEHLVERVESVEQVRFTNSGSEAVMMAVKAARAYTGRPKIAKFAGCYHGSYDPVEVSLAITPEQWDGPVPQAVPYSFGTPQAVLDTVVVLPFNDGETTERLIEQHCDQLAAVILDPAALRNGASLAERSFAQRLRELTAAHGIVLIFDEVISLRLAYGGTQSLLGVSPDLTAMGKIIGGGFPVGAVGGSAEVMSVFDPSEHYPKAPHGGTFNANPITMVAGLATMRKWTPEAVERLNQLGEQLREGLAEALDGARVQGHVSGIGSIFVLHLNDDPVNGGRESTLTPAEQRRFRAIDDYLVDHGVFTMSMVAGCLSTPMTEEHVNALVGTVADALEATKDIT
jgi:glutamate-1-semialdehyde 2,1-aminomutase